jgi:hypothetical protein
MTLALRNRIAGVLAAALVAAAWSPVTAHALSFTIDSAGDSQTVNWSLDIGGGITLSATGTFEALAVSSTTVDLGITITNLMSPSLNERVYSLGFNTDPAVTAAFLSQGGVFDGLGNDTVFPGFQTIELCAFAAQNCAGGNINQALAGGGTDSFSLRLTGDFQTPPMLTLDTFAIQFMGDLGSYQFEGNGNSTPVPAPAPLIVLGAGILGMWLIRRRV